MKPRVSLRRALTDPNLLGRALDGDTWLAWQALLLAMMGEPLREAERKRYQTLTGRESTPQRRVEEFWGIVGRRGGKTRAMAVLAAYIAALCDHSDRLSPGERGVVLLIAMDQKQARVALGYIDGALSLSPVTAKLIESRSADAIRLANGIDIEVRSASFRRLRGMTAVAVIADEAAFWMNDESANPDTEILNAVRPALATTGGPLVAISSPYAKRGEVYETWRRHYGPDGDPLILVAQGASRDFNPSLPQSLIDRAMERDPAAARAEYLGLFRDDIESFVSRETVDACVASGVKTRPFVSGMSYFAFVDPSGGVSDSMTMAIAHREGRHVVLDVARDIPAPFKPESVVSQFATVLKSYGLRKVQGDRYAGEWPREQFNRHGVVYLATAKAKSDLYVDFLPLLQSGEVELLDDARLIGQICGLERRTGRSGRDSIDHAPNSHDDLANAVAGVAAMVVASAMVRPAVVTPLSWFFGDSERTSRGYMWNDKQPRPETS